MVRRKGQRAKKQESWDSGDRGQEIKDFMGPQILPEVSEFKEENSKDYIWPQISQMAQMEKEDSRGRTRDARGSLLWYN